MKIYEPMNLTRPTGEQCSAGALVRGVIDGYEEVLYATWYPQMGGYGGTALVLPRGGCFDVYVWHDGEFPFETGEPRRLHHCMAAQFVRFGEFVAGLPGMEDEPSTAEPINE